MNGVPMVGNAIVPQPGANHIEIVDEVYKRLEYIKKDLPDDVKVEIGFDNTQYIRTSIREVAETIALAFLLVVVIIYFFLRNWRTTMIPIIVIPVSLIGAFFIMYIAGFTINVLTLLAIVLAIGLVVDDAIVMMENIYVKIENGMDPMEAGLKGSEEIFFAIIATTITLIAVFFPIVFLCICSPYPHTHVIHQDVEAP
jgi:multidrug efflux pump